MEKRYISTSIAYINAEPHIGFLLELVSADVLARYHRQLGDDVFFLTGTDEHGAKVAQAAEKAGLETQQYADKVSEKFLNLTKDFNIGISQFIRTTDPEHVKHVKVAWQKLAEKKVLEKRSYTGYYCTGCEAFKTEREILDGKCTIHEAPVEKIEEENWFLLITPETKEKIKAWLPAVRPVSKQNEILNILDDYDSISVSRPKETLKWGIEVPNDPEQVMYVWVDALLNYITGIFTANKSVKETWQNQIQIIGKDILKFHAIIWPALLIALELPLPKQLLVHGFVNVEGKKMSKSLGNVITPAELRERYGVDGTRYLLLRQLSFYDDSSFSWAEFDAIYNGELANGIGNLVARVVGLLKRLNHPVKEVISVASNDLELFDFAGALTVINAEIKGCDKAITEHKIWENIAEDKEKQEQLFAVAGKIAGIADLLEPFTPDTAQEIRRQLTELDPKPLFPRL